VNLILFGLGNPGPAYSNTRHNIGHWFVDKFALKQNVTFNNKESFYFCEVPFMGGNILLLKSSKFMNDNGKGLRPFLRNNSAKDHNLFLVHDELTLPLGRIKLSEKKSSAGHKGVSSVHSELGFSPPRLRIGVGGERAETVPVSQFVLSKFTSVEALTLENLLPNLFHSVKLMADQGLSVAMNYTNTYPLPLPKHYDN